MCVIPSKISHQILVDGKPLKDDVPDDFSNIEYIFDFVNPLTKVPLSRKIKVRKVKSQMNSEYLPLANEYVKFLIDTDIINPMQLTLVQDKFLASMLYDFPIKRKKNGKGDIPGIGRYFKRMYYDRYFASGKIREGREFRKPPETDSIYPNRLFAPSESGTSGKTTLILGSSGSGKTYLLVKEISFIKPGEYDLIILFTESVNAEPLAPLKKRHDILIKEGFDENIPVFLKELNNRLNLRYKFLFILDDIINEKSNRNSILGQMITTFRNSNISTVVLAQYPTIISKESRGNFHQLVVTGMRTVEANQALTSRFDLKSWAKKRMLSEGEITRNNIYDDEIHNYLRKILIDNGIVLYVDLKKSKDPSVVRV